MSRNRLGWKSMSKRREDISWTAIYRIAKCIYVVCTPVHLANRFTLWLFAIFSIGCLPISSSSSPIKLLTTRSDCVMSDILQVSSCHFLSTLHNSLNEESTATITPPPSAPTMKRRKKSKQTSNRTFLLLYIFVGWFTTYNSLSTASFWWITRISRLFIYLI